MDVFFNMRKVIPLDLLNPILALIIALCTFFITGSQLVFFEIFFLAMISIELTNIRMLLKKRIEKDEGE